MMIILVLTAYFAVMVLIGIISSRRVKSSGDYFLGGKGAGPILTAFRFSSTFESGSMMLGVPGLGYQAGYVTFNQGFLGPLGYFFSFRVFGQRVKVCCDHMETLTVPALLEKRYRSSLCKILASIAIVIGLTASIIAQLKAMGEVFAVLLSVEYRTAVWIGVAVIAIYSIFGGYLGNAFANVVQGVLMVGGSVILFVFTNRAFFGSYKAGNIFPALNDYLLNEVGPHMLHLTAGGAMPLSTLLAMLVVSLTIGLALPQQTVALFAMKDHKVGKLAMIISAFFSFICYWTLVPAGMMATKLIPGIENADNVIPVLATTVLPSFLAGVFIAGLLSAIMSTASNLFLVVASAFSRDIFASVAPKTYEKHPVVYDRIATVIVIVSALAIALNPPAIIFQIIVFAFTMIALTFVMPMLGVIYWKKATRYGAIAAMLVGSIFIPFWTAIGEPGVQALLVALIAAPTLFIVVSLLTQSSISDEDRRSIDALFAKFKEMKV